MSMENLMRLDKHHDGKIVSPQSLRSPLSVSFYLSISNLAKTRLYEMLCIQWNNPEMFIRVVMLPNPILPKESRAVIAQCVMERCFTKNVTREFNSSIILN